MNYYNEFDPYAAQWLRNLIAEGHIPYGHVDERSIEDVVPNELTGYAQCHFFAGLGGWSRALEIAGWASDRNVWTGSCPCQPFSAAGKGDGFDDQRHLWPAWQHLIAQCQPSIIFGEQVASKAAEPWIDLVHADMEGLGYAFGCIPYPAAGVGAPHIRDRNYWVADAASAGRIGRRAGEASHGRDEAWLELERLRDVSGVGDADHARPQGFAGHGGAAGRQESRGSVAAPGVLGGLADCASGGRREECQNDGGIPFGDSSQGLAAGLVDGCCDRRPGPTNGLWRDADWLLCTDGKWRAVEPGTFPLAHGVPGRVGRLRAYGNAIVPQQAAEFIKSVMGY